MFLSKEFFIISLIFITSSCVKFESDEAASGGAPSQDLVNDFSKKKKVFKTDRKVIHDFTVRQNIEIPQNKINDKTISHVVLENKDGSYLMVIDREDLLSKSNFSIPISEEGEKIKPTYVRISK